MRAINRLLEVTAIKKYQKYISSQLIPKISEYLGVTFNSLPAFSTPYDSAYRSVANIDGKYVDIVIKVTTNSKLVEGGDAFILNLMINGRSFQTSLRGKDLEEDIDKLSIQFDRASREFDINLSLEDDKFDVD